MVGICGTVGTDPPSLDAMAESLYWTGDESTRTHRDGGLAVTTVGHPPLLARTVAQSDRGTRAWVWGSVWGFDGPGGYEVVDAPTAAACVDLYDRYGPAFVSGLNGSFVGLVQDDAGQVCLFTDRVGSRALHYAHTDGGLVFSTALQSLPQHPAIPAAFDIEYLTEYFALNRTLGVRTPLAGVELVPPGSTATVSLADPETLAIDRYWQPVYEPVDRPRSYFANRLATLMARTVTERTRSNGPVGLLLSGGSDSRMVLAAMTEAGIPVHAFHLNEWRNTEAEIAETAASIADAEFTLLRRTRDYTAGLLDRTPAISNLVGYFNQAHAAGFESELTDAVDVLYTGHYGDMLFKGNHLRRPTVDIGPVGSFELPVGHRARTTQDLVDARVGNATIPPYVVDGASRDLTSIYASNVVERNGRVIDHGVAFDSPWDAEVCSRVPLTNGTSQFFYYGTLQMLPTHIPFLDNRLLDLFLTIPRRHLIRGNLVGGAIAELSPQLAALPHGDTGVPLSSSFTRQWLGRVGTGFRRRHFDDSPHRPHWSHGPWPDHAALVRTHGFLRDLFDERESIVRELPFLSWDGVNEAYRTHQDGDDQWGELYTLATFLGTPMAQLAAAETEHAPEVVAG